MDNNPLSVHSLPEHIIHPLLIASNSSTPEKALEILTEASRTADGRSDLASKNILPKVLVFCQNLSYPSSRHLLLLSLKLLRNLCAGELTNQISFVEHSGVRILFSTLHPATSDSDIGMIRMGLQVLANVSLAGEQHQLAIWDHFFPYMFVQCASKRRKETCDPLCMVVYICCDGSNELLGKLCGDQGLTILVEIVRTASAVGFQEDWLKLLLSRFCLEENQFPQLFARLCPVGASENSHDLSFRNDVFVSEQAFLLNIISEILNEQIGEIPIGNDFASCVFGILKQVDCVSSEERDLRRGSSGVDILEYSLRILRDLCASVRVSKLDFLLSTGLLELLLCLLRDLGPPTTIRKTMKQSDNNKGTASYSFKQCPYKGFRRDLVSVIANCAYGRKHVQDKIRERNGILLLLQQCVVDEDNLFLREWGIWAVRNLLDGNAENQWVVAELEIQGSVDIPEITRLGLKVEVDQKTRRARLVNAS